jgi:hypothetical protein
MGKMRFVTVMIPALAIAAALSLPAAAQSTSGPPHGQPGKGPPPKAAPAPRGPAAGAHPHGPPGPGARPAYAGHPGPGHAGRPAYYARHPNFARRDFHGHFYRGSLAWDRGVWRQEWHNGRYGWWWDVGGAWYFYEQPIYPYPTVISTVEVFDDPAMAGAPPLDGAYAEPAPVVVAPPPAVVVAPPPAVVVVPPPIVCVGPLCVR